MPTIKKKELLQLRASPTDMGLTRKIHGSTSLEGAMKVLESRSDGGFLVAVVIAADDGYILHDSASSLSHANCCDNLEIKPEDATAFWAHKEDNLLQIVVYHHNRLGVSVSSKEHLRRIEAVFGKYLGEEYIDKHFDGAEVLGLVSRGYAKRLRKI